MFFYHFSPEEQIMAGFWMSKIELFPEDLFMGISTDPIPRKSVNGTRGTFKTVTLDGVYRLICNYITRAYIINAISRSFLGG